MVGKRVQGELLTRFMAGDRVALARTLTHAENGTEQFPSLYDELYARCGQAVRIGVTGPPGAGKSTLVEALALHYRKDDEHTVGIVAVDPTSPFSGGALLGDRVRMQRLTLDPGVFVRSMASRGSVGGLAQTTDEVADIMDAFGFPRVFIETVGVGQSEVDVASSAGTTLVVLFPGAGDAIQAMKAGLMEIADIFVVNKADLPGADRVEVEISDMLHLRPEIDGWQPPILKCSAHNDEGIAEISEAIASHQQALIDSGELERRRRDHLEHTIKRIVEAAVRTEIWEKQGQLEMLESVIAEGKNLSPFSLAERIVKRIFDEVRRS